MSLRTTLFLSALIAFSGAGDAFAAGGKTLQAVKARGYLKCGVSDGTPGFSSPDANGNWSGLDVDFCRAIAAAIFNDPDAVRYTATTAKERFTALQSGEVDLLSRGTTWTMQRDVAQGFEFTGVVYYDGQGFLVRAADNVKSVNEMNGATVCTQSGTTTELNLADYFRSHGMTYNLLTFDKDEQALGAYSEGRCDTYTTDVSGIYAERSKLANPADHVILPETISKEPLGPLVRSGDDNWEDIVRWTLFAQLNAEELGVTQRNLDEMLKSPSPEIRRLLGLEGSFGRDLGLTDDWAVRIIHAIGNYGEMFERNIGVNTPLGIERGVNNLWTKGGIQYAPPIR